MSRSKRTTQPTQSRGDESPRLLDVKSIPEPMRRTLATLDITHVDQLRGVASVPDSRRALLDQLDVSDDALDNAIGKDGSTTVPAPPRFTLGALLPPPAARAFALSIPFSSTRATLTPLPPSANLASLMPPVRDQGNRGTCVAFALSAIHEYARRTSHRDYSERDLYYEAKQVDGNPAACGTTQAAASQVLAANGQCVESLWPYNPTAACNANGTPPSAPAREKQELVPLNPHDVVAIKTALHDKRPVAISIPVYNSWYQSPAVARTGRITMPIAGEQYVGGHCVCIVGYQDDTASTVTETPGGGFFILRNSWGTTLWGAQCPFGAGYGTIPYAYVAAFNWEAYTLPRRRRHSSKTTTAKRGAAKRSSAKRSSAKRSSAQRGSTQRRSTRHRD